MTYEPTRTTLGKLPTDFTRQTSCNAAWIWDSSFIDYAVTCSTTSSAEPHINSDTSCYPYPSGDYAYPLDPVFFSPASICPQGFTSACNVTRNAFDQVPASVTYGEDASDVIKYVLKDGETAIGCCPIGYECDKNFVQSCTSTFTAGQVIAGTTYGRSCSSEATTYTFPATTEAIGLQFLSADQMNVWMLHDPNKDNGTSSHASTGLSTGAKIGIGVGIPLGVIAMGILVFVCCHRSRKIEKERRLQLERQAKKPTGEPVLPPHMEKPELQGSDAQTGDAGPIRPRTELETRTAIFTAVAETQTRPPELDGSRTEAAPRHELDNSASATITNFAELSGDPYRYELDGGEHAKWKTKEI